MRETVITVPSARLGEFRSVRNPLRMSESPFEVPSVPPEVGEHTTEVLQAELGLSLAEIEALERRGAIGRSGAAGSAV